MRFLISDILFRILFYLYLRENKVYCYLIHYFSCCIKGLNYLFSINFEILNNLRKRANTTLNTRNIMQSGKMVPRSQIISAVSNQLHVATSLNRAMTFICIFFLFVRIELNYTLLTQLFCVPMKIVQLT